jgi:GNAT superfamily N-acetyltransferase
MTAGLPLLRLETGPLNHAAMRVYAQHGFRRCGAFGAYPDAPSSVFFERPTPALRRMTPEDDMAPVHALLTGAFAFMEGVIDPPSSMNRLTPAGLATEAGKAELWVIEGQTEGVLACMILTDRGETLYLGKLAVAQDWRGSGLARVMIDHAVARARALGRPAVTLQTRVELTGNHRAFQKLGFVETGRTAHPGYTRPTTVNFSRQV